MKIKAVEIQNNFSIENLKIVEKEVPKIDKNEILVKIKAVSLNYRDLLVVEGKYNPNQKLPLIPCSDGAGEVIEVGESVKKFKKGDKVVTTFFQDWISGKISYEKTKTTLGSPLNGTLCNYMILKENGLIKFPEYLSYEEASTLPCAALTAWNSIINSKIKPGDSVLIQGTGGVGVFSIQLSKLFGAKVILISSSNKKIEKIKEKIGIDYAINYKEIPNWSKKVKEITNNKGVDHIIELGGAKTLNESLNSITFGGTINIIGVLSGISHEINIIPIIMKKVKINGIFVGNKEDFENMNKALSVHQVKPIIDKIFKFEDVKEAFKYMKSGEHIGKICIKID